MAGLFSHLQFGDGAVGVLNHLGGIGVEIYLNRCLILIFDSYAITGPVKTCYRDTRQLLLIEAIARLSGQGQQPMVHPLQVGREIVAWFQRKVIFIPIAVGIHHGIPGVAVRNGKGSAACVALHQRLVDAQPYIEDGGLILSYLPKLHTGLDLIDNLKFSLFTGILAIPPMAGVGTLGNGISSLSPSRPVKQPDGAFDPVLNILIGRISH